MSSLFNVVSSLVITHITVHSIVEFESLCCITLFQILKVVKMFHKNIEDRTLIVMLLIVAWSQCAGVTFFLNSFKITLHHVMWVLLQCFPQIDFSLVQVVIKH